MFVGKSKQSVGRDGRMHIPSKMRDIIRAKYDEEDMYVVMMPGNTICIYPGKEFTKVIDRLENPQEASITDTLCIERICAEAEPCKLDRYGRITVPSMMLEKAGIKYDILVIGALTHIEIWDPAYWQYSAHATCKTRTWSIT